MYPASRLVRPDPRSPHLPKLLSLVAALVLLFGALEVFSVYQPKHPYLVENGVPVDRCALSFGPAPHPVDPGYAASLARRCHTVVPDQHVPIRVGIGLATIAVVFALMVGGTRGLAIVPSGP